MTDAEWSQVRASMPVPAWQEGRGERPESHYHREIVGAVRCTVDNGGKWRALPVDYPYWRAVYDFFRRWSRHGYVREFYQRLRHLERMRQGRAAEPGAGIMARSRWTARRPAPLPPVGGTATNCATDASAKS
ncbi:transposase [Streptacidiphilus sp. N1-12]|uniref:Transposase n=2 Tax=Streptacidiphilus alkalitolerans TaxID=3342712 RepID=A0ABV6W7A9_9ACTN